jgi:4-hydroxy-tetrahydrodipicolinate synthase
LSLTTSLFIRLKPSYFFILSLFIESNPIPVKAALQIMDKIEYHIRPPLACLDRQHFNTIKAALLSAGALEN